MPFHVLFGIPRTPYSILPPYPASAPAFPTERPAELPLKRRDERLGARGPVIRVSSLPGVWSSNVSQHGQATVSTVTSCTICQRPARRLPCRLTVGPSLGGLYGLGLTCSSDSAFMAVKVTRSSATVTG
jgi:hypothetical protein